MAREVGSDPRITKYCKAIEQMCAGKFDLHLSLDADDPIGRLGDRLDTLSKEFQQQFNLLRNLSDLTERVNSGRTLEEVLDHVYREFHAFIPYDRIGFSLLSEDGSTLHARWARTESSNPRITANYSAPMGGSSLERIITSGKPRILNDLVKYSIQRPSSESTRLIVEEGMQSSLTCPLIANGKPIGFIFFSSMRPSTYSDAHVEIFQIVAGQLAGIVEKARLYQELLELMEMKNRFLGIAAHDLRNPIAAVSGYTKILAERISEGNLDRQLELCERIGKVTRKMLTLVEDLLDVSAIESGKLQLSIKTVGIREVVLDAVSDNEIVAQAKSITLKAEIPDSTPTVNVDVERITQVLDNLISNAVKFSKSDTIIRIRIESVLGGVQVSVLDQGQGIPAGEIGLLFKEFSRTSTTPTGGEKSTGLGLALVRRIIEMHGGRVWAESEYGKGSTFTFFLPTDDRNRG